MFNPNYVATVMMSDRTLKAKCREAFADHPDIKGFVIKLVARLTEMGIRRGAYRRAEALSSSIKNGRTIAVIASVASGPEGEKLRRIRFTRELEVVTDETGTRPLPDLGFKQNPSRSEEVLDKIWSGESEENILNQQDPRRAMGDYRN